MRPVRETVSAGLRRGNRVVVAPARRELTRRALAGRIPGGSKLHLGCGHNRFAGWIHIDLDRSVRPEIVHDLRAGLPIDEGMASLIYSEHVLEHLPLEAGCQLLADCRAALGQGGVLRVAMPDLRSLVDAYEGDWRGQEWLEDRAYDEIDTPARMLNVAMRWWGHVYLYDKQDLEVRLRAAGFTSLRWPGWGESEVAELRGRETRPDSRLIVEAACL
jgi:predicted SAM-dependent methyltransferase